MTTYTGGLRPKLTGTFFRFRFFKQGPAYKNEGPDPGKGSNQQ